jgi:predicted  nucleic acid-binding Zn-ribbon protein
MRSLSFALAAMPVAGELMLGQGPNPIQRVIKLLNQMKSELDEERKADEKLYEDLQCWCKTNKKDKEAAIAENKNKAKNLEAEINKYAGSSGEYKAAMQIAEEAVKKAEKKLEDETASHEETVKGLRNDETDLTGTVNALENAIQVLGKH